MITLSRNMSASTLQRASVLVFALCLGLVASAAIPQGCTGHPNTIPINKNAPKFIRSVPNGKLFQLQNVQPPINVIHVWGTPYERGYAQGQLLAKDIQEFLPEMTQYFEEAVHNATGLPTWLSKIIGDYGVPAALDATKWATESFTPDYFFEEVKGIAEGAGVSYKQLYELHMFPELIKAACTMVGAWGPASEGGSLYQLRALDFITNGPLQNFPTLTVYHTEEDQGHDFAIFTFSGFIGAITGISSKPLGICEKVWLHYKGQNSRFGIPWHFLLRDILQFDADVPAALKRIENADRTCSIFVGLGDPVNNFTIVEYSYESAVQLNAEYENHPRMEGLRYADKHTQPSHNPCLADLLKDGYGHINAEYFIQTVAPILATGDTHAAVYDFATMNIYLAAASVWNKAPAYDRQWTMVDMNKQWAIEKPQN